MGRFGKRLVLHTLRTLTGPLMLPGLAAAWLKRSRIANAAVVGRLKARAAIAGTAGTAGALTLGVVGDTHYGLDGVRDLHAAVETLAPAGVVHLGDYSDDGGLYETLRHLSNWDLLYQARHAGVVHVLGNHDKRTLGRFWFERLFGPMTAVFDLGVWRLVVLNNTAKDDVFSAADITLLEGLAGTPKPTLLCFHKPPACERWPKHVAPDRVPELFRAAKRAGVKLALCGHCHVFDEAEIEGVKIVISGGGSVPGSELGFGTVGRHILAVTLPADGGTPEVRQIALG